MTKQSSSSQSRLNQSNSVEQFGKRSYDGPRLQAPHPWPKPPEKRDRPEAKGGKSQSTES